MASSAYSLYQANKLKDQFLDAVKCAIQPLSCKKVKISLMAATFALMIYVIVNMRTKEQQWDFGASQKDPQYTTFTEVSADWTPRLRFRG